VRFQEKWRLALTRLRQVRAAGIDVTAVVGDAEFGDNATLRRTLHRAHLPYALGVSSDLKVFLGTPLASVPPSGPRGRPRTQLVLAPGVASITAQAWAAAQPARAWRLVSWRNGTNRPWRARFLAQRVTPAHEWRDRRHLAAEVWLLGERDVGPTPRTKYYLVHLPVTASLRDLVHLAHQRWAIEQQYQELKDELGLDHFEGRSLPGWEHHVVLTALAYSFLQGERRQRRRTGVTFPQVRAVMQDVLTAHFLLRIRSSSSGCSN
jgi:SRSO17 transposase